LSYGGIPPAPISGKKYFQAPILLLCGHFSHEAAFLFATTVFFSTEILNHTQMNYNFITLITASIITIYNKRGGIMTHTKHFLTTHTALHYKNLFQ
jgi:hypothetical protein